jgi:DNA mismatch endonuclease (patch repair protein)
MMSGIHGKNTQPEFRIRRLLHGRGFRYRLHDNRFLGKPDLVFPKYHAIVFIHGCFWHGHDCPLFRLPGTRPDFWRDKITRNRDNDQVVLDALRKSGWRIAVVWECAIRGKTRLADNVLADLLSAWLTSSVEILNLRGVERQEIR